MNTLHQVKYRIVNKKTQCIEESIHVVFDEDGNLKINGSIDEDEVIKLFNSQKIKGNEVDAKQQLKNDYDNNNHSLSEKTDEVEKCDEVPHTTLNSSQSTSNSPENGIQAVSNGCQKCVSEWRSERGSICQTTSWF